jgi:P pilus assembly chaperone PapD
MTLPRYSRILLLLSVTLLGPASAWSGAVLFIYPTLIMFEGNERSATVTLTNRGDSTGTFETSWSELAMTDEGGLIKVDGEPSWSVRPYVRYSPRRVTLEPSGSQVIKIALRRDQEAAEGEYYSHFKVLTLNTEELADDSKETTSAANTNSGVTITARSAVAIPIIWRNSRAAPRATIESVDIDANANHLNIGVRRHGKLSVRGYLHVLGTTSDGTRSALAERVPLVIYPGLDKRVTSITLNEGMIADALPDDAEVFFTSDLNIVNEDTILASYPVLP